MRAYSNRFESLLARLPTFDAEWAKSQYVWGLNQKIAELVVIAEPADLQAAILKAEKIDMARGMVADNQGQSSGGWFRSSRGRFTRGRGRMTSVQHAARTINIFIRSRSSAARRSTISIRSARTKTKLE